jgi:hypothetical protein
VYAARHGLECSWEEREVLSCLITRSTQYGSTTISNIRFVFVIQYASSRVHREDNRYGARVWIAAAVYGIQMTSCRRPEAYVRVAANQPHVTCIFCIMVTIVIQPIHSFRKKIQSITCQASGRPSATTPLLHEGANRELLPHHRCQVLPHSAHKSHFLLRNIYIKSTLLGRYICQLLIN